ncbi:MAG TPA: hypothetical protein DEO57_08665 [Phycisphaerales bacterium]|nr:hypothetical protein [Phycisphaerales bacterium]
MYDTHCHLVSKPLHGSLDAVLARAAQADVTGMITVSTSMLDCVEGLKLAQFHPHIWCTAGVHPHEADSEVDWEVIESVASHDRCVAWGELGLDWHYQQPLRASQHALLEAHLGVIGAATGRQAKMPVVIHCREAYGDLLAILRDSGLDPTRFVFHCFTGNEAEMDLVLDFGASVSFTGIVTFGNASDIQEAARRAPLDRMMVETDAPYLSPEPVRSMRPNEPCNVVHTARFLASLRGMETAAFVDIMDANATRFFGLG